MLRFVLPRFLVPHGEDALDAAELALNGRLRHFLALRCISALACVSFLLFLLAEDKK